MGKLSCAFFGHRNYDYKPYEDKIRECIVDLINRGVTDFYNGYRGAFDYLCARIVDDLKEEYPRIKNIMVLSYFPDEKFEKPEIFDETAYLLERRVPYRYAIAITNKKIVQTVDYVISGVVFCYGGAKIACDYAKKLLKTIFYVTKDCSYCDNDWVVNEWKEKMNDEKYRIEYEKKVDLFYQSTRQEVEANISKLKNKKGKRKEYEPPEW